MDRVPIILDGNEAAASVAYRLNEVIAIYPITPSSPHGRVGGRVALGREEETTAFPFLAISTVGSKSTSTTRSARCAAA